ncbi:MAG: NAD(P)/FAD-dependent oxidoreductase [Candidatus Omnitrophota bacterium]|nr:NAD(P)/FAD-dependent oxidoreductase [Candidatus Omnitrophota bacterium]
MHSYDVIIIGGGVIGVSIARELSRYKLTIAILEKEEELAFGVSKSNSGIIHPGTQNSPASLKGRLCVRGNRLIRTISKELGVDFKEVGELIVATSEAEVRVLKRMKKDAETLGVPRLEMVGTGWLKREEPNLTCSAVAALYAPTAGIVSPYRLVYDLGENAARNGVEIHTRAKVEDIIRLKTPPSRGGARFRLAAPKTAFTAKYVINAAGLFADEISKMVGVKNFVIKPRKGEEFLLDKKRAHLTNHLIFPLPSKVSKGVLVIRTSDGNPMIGPTAEEVDDKFDLSTSKEALAKAFKLARRLVPSIDENDIIAYFAGLRPAAGDDFIIRHEDKAPGFINAAGIQSPGLTAAPAIALLVRDILKENGLDMEPKSVFHKHIKKTTHLFAAPFSRAKRLVKRDRSYGDIVCRCEMVSAGEIRDAIARGAGTLDGIKFRTRAQAGRCHGSFCTTRILKILARQTGTPITALTKRGKGSEVLKGGR